MAKRTEKQFERIPRDYYPTPLEGVLTLLPHLDPHTRFIEPCAGGGHLAEHLMRAGHNPIALYDVNGIFPYADARTHKYDDPPMFITNPPWTRELLHPIITNLSDQAPTWLLFQSDWLYTKQAIPFYSRIVSHVSAGRIEWFKGDPESTGPGKDNATWYLFDAPNHKRKVEFWR